MNFSDIPQFTRSANYRIDVDWDYMINIWLPEKIEKDGLQLDPDFQRAHVWNETQQIRYCEFIIRGGHSSTELFFNHPGWMSNFDGDMVLVDGKQRIEAVRRLIQNEIPVFGHFYNEYDDNLRITTARFSVNINDLKTRAEVLQWYIDLNAGGIAHTNDEIEKVRKLLDGEK